MAATSSSVWVTFVIILIVVAFVVLLFSWLRLTSALRRFYAPKRYFASSMPG